MERVDEPVGVVALAHEEVAGHPDADEADVEPAADLHQHGGERDGHAHPTDENLVEVGVAGIVVVVAVTREPVIDEDMADQRVERVVGAGRREVVEHRDPVGERIRGARSGIGQQEQCLVEGHGTVVAQELGQLVGGTHVPTVANYRCHVPGMSRELHPYLDVGHPIAFAHRGGADVHPENTEAAFRHALDLGFTHVETDVHVTRDGVAVAFHDDRLERVTDAAGAIAELSWATVRRARVAGTEPILRLDELLESFPETHVNLDPKHAAAVGPLADTILRTASVERVMVGAFSDRRIAAVKAIVGDRLATSAGPRQTAMLFARARGVPGRVPRVEAVQVPVAMRGVTIVTSGFVTRMHEFGIQVHVWTINEPAEMTRLLDLGVDGIMTDRPAVLRQVLIDRGEWGERR